MTGGKTICVVAKRSAPPAFIGALADRDTASCRPGARTQQAQAVIAPLVRLPVPSPLPARLRFPVPMLPAWFHFPVPKAIGTRCEGALR